MELRTIHRELIKPSLCKCAGPMMTKTKSYGSDRFGLRAEALIRKATLG